MLGEQVVQRLLFSRGQSLGGRQHGYSVAEGLSGQSFAAGLPRDPDRHRAVLRGTPSFLGKPIEAITEIRL